MKKLLTRILLIALSLLLFVGCSGNGGNQTSGSKILKVAKDTDIISLDTSIATDGLSFEVLETFSDGLVDYDADGVIIPRTALEWSVNDAGNVFTFKLREDAKWSNGDPVTAHDFVFSWRRTVNPATASEYAVIIIDSGIANAAKVNEGKLPIEDLGVKALDDYTLEVTLEGTVPYFLQMMTFGTFNPLNEAFVTAQGANYATSPETLLSNGPFILTAWNKGNSWTLSKNESYYDADKVKIDGIEYVLRQDYATSTLEFDSGSVHVTKISSDLITKYESNPAFNIQPIGYVWYMAPNQTKAEFKNANLRLALAYAIDSEHIVKDIMKDGSLAADYMVPSGLATGPDGKDFRETAPKYLTYDIEKAKEHWEKAKQELGVTTMTFSLLIEDSEESKTNAEQIQSDLSQLEGLTITIETVIKSVRLDRMRAKDYDLGLTRWGPDYADPFTYLGTLFPTGSNYNYAAYSNAEYDALVAKTAPGGEYATDAVKRWQAFVDAEAILLNEAGVVPIWQSGEAILINPNVQGIEYHVVGHTSYRNVTIK